MPLPVIPLVKGWNNESNYTASPTAIELAKGGITDRANTSINPVKRDWSIAAPIRSQAAYSALNAFLRSQRGRPFQFNYDGTPHPELVWCCKEWQFVQAGVSFWRFTAKFEQRYRLGV